MSASSGDSHDLESPGTTIANKTRRDYSKFYQFQSQKNSKLILVPPPSPNNIVFIQLRYVFKILNKWIHHYQHCQGEERVKEVKKEENSTKTRRKR